MPESREKRITFMQHLTDIGIINLVSYLEILSIRTFIQGTSYKSTCCSLDEKQGGSSLALKVVLIKLVLACNTTNITTPSSTQSPYKHIA